MPNVDRGLEAPGTTATRSSTPPSPSVVEELDANPGATVFFQDYHLYLAPRFVRDRCPDATLAHFIHIPWPSTGLLARAARAHALRDPRRAARERRRRLPRRALAAELPALGAEVIARLGTARTCSSPRSRSRSTRASSSAWPRATAVREHEAAIVAWRPEKLVVRVDRTDPSKNVVRGVRAFELYLVEHPEAAGASACWRSSTRRGRTSPSTRSTSARSSGPSADVNDRFRRDEWLPVELRVVDDFEQAVAAYKQFDVLQVNSVFDGCNLVAKEGPLVNERDGVVVLSENTGAFEELARLGDRGEPVRPRRPGGRDPPGARASGRRAPPRGSRRSGRT